MAKERTPIPSDIEVEVMFAHDRTCSVCRIPRKGIQIHHIDENPSNHKIENLAVLCLECHHQTQLKGGFARTMPAALVRRFRDDWVECVAERRKTADERAGRGEASSFPGNRPVH
jgi:5-methylcytosine-specific restriction endonuclease McrA